MEPTIGRIVHVVLDEHTQKALGGNHESMPQERIAAAIIVRHWGNGCCNLKVFGDSCNDVWMTSVGQYEGDLLDMDGKQIAPTRTWHWPARV